MTRLDFSGFVELKSEADATLCAIALGNVLAQYGAGEWSLDPSVAVTEQS